MSRTEKRFELPRAMERHLAALAKLYGREGKKDRQELLVNAHPRVQEEWSFDNWNGGTYGHALHLSLPEDLYLSVARQKEKLQKEIAADLNGLHNVQNEFIHEVFLEIEDGADDHDWRAESGLLRVKRDISPDTARRIWGESGYRVFLSHKAEVKKSAAEVKERLGTFGISAFVAHADIRATKKWEDEIESALLSMDAFVAIMTDKFHDSKWTDQEVGFALCRGVPIIALKWGTDPYGFIGRFQALSCEMGDAPLKIVELLIKHPRMIDAYIAACGRCASFDSGNVLAQILPSIGALDDAQAQKLVAAFNENTQISGSFGFSGEKPHRFGGGLPKHLLRLTGRKYKLSSDGRIRKV